MNAAHHDMLFGLLALQNGLIDQGQLVAAFQAWTRDKVHSLAEYLGARGDLDAEQRAGIEAMVELHLKKHGSDVAVSLAAVPAGQSTRESLERIGDPEINATLGHVGLGSPLDRGRRCLTAPTVVLRRLGHQRRPAVPRSSASRPGRAGGGVRGARRRAEPRGGAEADPRPACRRRQPAGNDFSWKPRSPAGWSTRASSRSTAWDLTAMAALTTPCGSSGATASRRPIDRFHADQGLKKDAGRRSLELRKLLKRFMDVCNAIDYAHSRGVLHRDIKPGNIIVGRHGETLVVDWGLAKATGKAEPGAEERTLMPSSASGSAETLPGSALGTPAYMSPEQARGDLDRLGPRSDVYSLGATLYCLLTGKPPFEGEDIGVVLRAVQQGQFPRPSQHDSGLDKTLEAICLKAMAKEPEDRYPTPKALADDLDRWMADEPVSAYPEPALARLARWGRRHRTLVAAAALLLMTAVAGLSVGTVLLSQANARTERQRRLAQANFQKAEDNFRKAREAVDEYFTKVSESKLLERPRACSRCARTCWSQPASITSNSSAIAARTGRCVPRRPRRGTASVLSRVKSAPRPRRPRTSRKLWRCTRPWPEITPASPATPPSWRWP